MFRYVWHGSDVTQYWFSCGSVVHSVVQMLYSIGSGMGRCGCPGVCGTMLWFSGVWCGSYVVHSWFMCGSYVCMYMCVFKRLRSSVMFRCMWHGSHVTQYWFICGSVVHSMVQMLSSIGSGVGRCVCPGVCGTMLWFSGVQRCLYAVQ